MPKQRRKHLKEHSRTEGKLDETASVNFHLPDAKIFSPQASRQVGFSTPDLLVKYGMTIIAIPFPFFLHHFAIKFNSFYLCYCF
jgi:hypothetical protein